MPLLGTILNHQPRVLQPSANDLEAALVPIASQHECEESLVAGTFCLPHEFEEEKLIIDT